jgi:hypothetical protein
MGTSTVTTRRMAGPGVDSFPLVLQRVLLRGRIPQLRNAYLYTTDIVAAFPNLKMVLSLGTGSPYTQLARRTRNHKKRVTRNICRVLTKGPFF